MRAVTSSSNIFRRKLCPGSQNLEASVVDLPGDNAAADEGTLLHPFACNPKLSRDHLTDEQRRRLMTADSSSWVFMGNAAFQFGANPLEQPPTWIEERVVLYGPDKEKLFDGQSDLVFQYPEGVAVEDFKMGRVEVTQAPTNYQVASYAVMWSDFLSVDRALVAINQPLAPSKLSSAIYDRKSLDGARRELAAIVHAAEDKNAPRIAGEKQCQYCRGKLFCDEYKARFMALELRPDTQSICTLPNDELHRFGIACKTADRIKCAVLSEITRRIEAGEMPEWELKPNGESREVHDIVGAYKELSAYFERIGGFDGKKFTDCTTVVWSRLTGLVRELTGFTEGRAKALISELLNPHITRKQKAPTPQPKDTNL